MNLFILRNSIQFQLDIHPQKNEEALKQLENARKLMNDYYKLQELPRFIHRDHKKS